MRMAQRRRVPGTPAAGTAVRAAAAVCATGVMPNEEKAMHYTTRELDGSGPTVYVNGVAGAYDLLEEIVN